MLEEYLTTFDIYYEFKANVGTFSIHLSVWDKI